MDLIEFRDYCLSFEGVTENTPFGKFADRYDSILVFYIAGHMFCIIDMDDFTFVNVRSTSEKMAEIRNRYTSVSDPLNKSLRYWIRIDLNGDVPDSMIRQFVSEAYDIVKTRYTKNKLK